ncbi:Kinase [Hexamita inflata]|uniref:Kinase n=2 Tax=Hexamita inflata TaxID=28002 RepID=A0AA86NGE5_9EUKA|nr:Kinase [Hexamita inflata]
MERISQQQINHGMFCKSFITQSGQKLLVTKIFQEPSFSVAPYILMLDYYRQQLSRAPHCMAYIAWQIADQNVYLIRPHLFGTVLTHQNDKIYSAYQMIVALRETHMLGLVHGDVKLSNFLLTQTGEVILTDFAPFKPGVVEDKDQVFMSYFFNTPRSPERISQSDVREFVMSQQETDVFELGLALVELFNRRLTKSEVLELYNGSLQNIGELPQQFKELVTKMLNKDPKQRPKLAELQLEQLFPQMIYKLLNIRNQFNESADNNVKVLEIALDCVLAQADKKCYNCKTGTKNQKLYDEQYFIVQKSACDKKFPPEYKEETAAFKMNVADANSQDSLVFLINYFVHFLQSDLLEENVVLATKQIALAFSYLDEAHSQQVLPNLMQLLNQTLHEQHLLEMFTFVFNCLPVISGQYIYAPFYAFCRYFLLVDDWFKCANELIQSIRKPGNFRFNRTLKTETSIPLIKLCKCIGLFTSALLRLNKSTTLREIYSEIFIYAQDSIISLVLQHNKEIDSTEVLLASFLMRIRTVYDDLSDIVGRLVILLNPKNDRVFQTFLRYSGQHQFILKGWEQKLNLKTFLDDIQKLVLVTPLVQQNQISTHFLMKMCVNLIDQMCETFFDSANYCNFRFINCDFLAYIMGHISNNEDNFIKINHTFIKILQNKFSSKMTMMLRQMGIQGDIRNNKIECRIEGEKQTELMNFLGQVQISKQKSALNVDIVVSNTQLTIQFYPQILTLQQIKKQKDTLAWLLNMRTQFLTFFNSIKNEERTITKSIRYQNMFDQPVAIMNNIPNQTITFSALCQHYAQLGKINNYKPINAKSLAVKLMYPENQIPGQHFETNFDKQLPYYFVNEILNQCLLNPSISQDIMTQEKTLEKMQQLQTHFQKQSLFQFLQNRQAKTIEDVKDLVQAQNKISVQYSNDFLFYHQAVLENVSQQILTVYSSWRNSSNFTKGAKELTVQQEYLVLSQSSLWTFLQTIIQNCSLVNKISTRQFDIPDECCYAKIYQQQMLSQCHCAHLYKSHYLFIGTDQRLSIYYQPVNDDGREIAVLLGKLRLGQNTRLSGLDSMLTEYMNVLSKESETLEKSPDQQIGIVHWQSKLFEMRYFNVLLQGLIDKPLAVLPFGSKITNISSNAETIIVSTTTGTYVFNINIDQLVIRALDAYCAQPQNADRFAFKFCDPGVQEIEYSFFTSAQMQTLQQVQPKIISVNNISIPVERLQTFYLDQSQNKHLQYNVCALCQDQTQSIFIPKRVDIFSFIEQQNFILSALRRRSENQLEHSHVIKLIGGLQVPEVIISKAYENLYLIVTRHSVIISHLNGIILKQRDFDMSITAANFNCSRLILTLQKQYIVDVSLIDFSIKVLFETQDVTNAQVIRFPSIIRRHNLLYQLELDPNADLFLVMNSTQITILHGENTILEIRFQTAVKPTVVLQTGELLMCGWADGSLVLITSGQKDIYVKSLPLRSHAKNPIRVLNQQQLDTCFYPGAGFDGHQTVWSNQQGTEILLWKRNNMSGKLKNGNQWRDEIGLIEAGVHIAEITQILELNGRILTIDLTGKSIWWVKGK